MLLTVFLAIVFCAAITLMLLSAVAFIQNKKLFSSAPKEAQEVIKPRTGELFYGARAIGRTLMAFGILMILGVGVISIWDGFRQSCLIRFFRNRRGGAVERLSAAVILERTHVREGFVSALRQEN